MAPPDHVDLGASISFFRRRLSLIVAVVLVALAIGAAVSFMSERVYSASATVTLEVPVNSPPHTAGTATTSGPPPSSSFVDTQLEIITSRELAHRVAAQLDLLQGKDEAGQRKVLDELQRGISAQRTGESYALSLRFDGATGEEAARRVNAYARQFADWELQATRERNQDSRALVSSQLDRLRRQAHQDTEALQRYRIANNLLSTSGASLTEQEISSYNQEVTRARAEAAADRARLNTALNQLRSGSTGEDVGEALESSVISGLRGRESQVGGELANLASRYGPNHPELVRTKGELAEIRHQIQAEIGRVISNLQAKINVSQQRVQSLTASLSAAEGQLSNNNAAMVRLDELQRKAEASQGLYETYLNSYKQLAAQDGTERPNARILSLAEPPALPSSPDVVMNLLLALAIGLGVGIAAAYIVESFSNTVKTPDQIERDLGRHFLGSIPLLSSVSKTATREVPAVAQEPRSAFAESFRSLHTSITQAARVPAQIIAITSALPKEGKTTVAACLGQCIAQSGVSTILIDCDFRQRGLSRLIHHAHAQPDLFDVLAGRVALDDAILTGAASFAVLPMRQGSEEAEWQLTGERFNQLLAALRVRYDQIILDLPPVLPIAATRAMAESADATVLVARWSKTPTAAVRTALNQLPSDRVNLVGITMSHVDMRRRGQFGDTDPHYYFSRYRQYYQ